MKSCKTPDHLRARHWASKERNFPVNTCPASRLVHLIADCLSKGKKRYPMLQEEPEHCAGSMYATVASLFMVRTKLAAAKEQIKKLKAENARLRKRRVRP